MQIELTANDDIIPVILAATAPAGATVIYSPPTRTRSGGMMQFLTTASLVTFAVDISKQVLSELIVKWLTDPKFKDRLKLKKNGVSVEITDSNLYELLKDRD